MAARVSERSLEIKVGAFVLLGLVLLVGFVLVLGNVSFGGGETIHVEYGFSGAVHEGAPVEVSGVSVGRVSKVEFLGAGVRDKDGRPLLVRLTLSLEPRARDVVRTDTKFVVSTQGVLGAPYVEILPGEMRGTVLADGATVRGVDPPRTDLLMARLYTFLDGLTDALSKDKDVLHDLFASGGSLAKTLDQVLAENREGLTKGLGDVLAALSDLRKVAHQAAVETGKGGDLHVLIANARDAVSVLHEDLPPLLARAQVVGDELARLSKVSGKLDANDAQHLKEALAHYDELGKRLDKVSGDLQALLTRVDRGEGTVGALLQDDQIYDDLKELVRDLKAHPWKVLWKH